jgi:bacterial regulatory helix-turn-helix proteins, araC family
VAFEVGYTNASKFASTFRNVVGMAPGDYRESAGQER